MKMQTIIYMCEIEFNCKGMHDTSVVISVFAISS